MENRRTRRKKQVNSNVTFMLIGTGIIVFIAVAAVIFVMIAVVDTGAPVRADDSSVSIAGERETIADEADFETVQEEYEPNPHDSTTEQYNEPPEPASPFSVFSFYIPENAAIYESFQSENPHLDTEAIIWMVNSSLHLPFFEEITTVEGSNPLLINTYNRLPSGFSPIGLLPVNSNECDLRATMETVEAFRNLRQAARDAGFDLSVVSAYRSAARQRAIFERQGSVDGAVMRPYHSEHQTGRALDLWGPGSSGLLDHGGATPVGDWVAANVNAHGFILRYPYGTTHITGIIFEPWHITYVGMEISTYMYENGIETLEEFVGRNPGAGMDWVRR